jgi:hypothetical protein
MSDFIDRLSYLLTLSIDGRRKNKDYFQMRELLIEDGHWKNRKRGKHARKSKHKKNLCVKPTTPMYNKQGSMSDEDTRQKEYFETLF